MTDQLLALGNPAPTDFFVGEAYLAGLEDNGELSAGNVTFRAGARNNWHTHTVGQLLIVTNGEGLYQEEDKPARRIRRSDTVYTAAGVNHWHGATADQEMAHVAVTLKDPRGDVVAWGNSVTDEEFATANSEAK